MAAITTQHADEAHRRRGGGIGKHYMKGLYSNGANDDYDGDEDYGHRQRSAAASVAKALAAGLAAFSMLLLSGLALTATVLALIVATPLLVIFSPVLVPAVVTVALLTAGFVSSGAFGTSAVAVLAWMYRYLQPSDQQQTATSSSRAHGVVRDH